MKMFPQEVNFIVVKFEKDYRDSVCGLLGFQRFSEKTLKYLNFIDAPLTNEQQTQPYNLLVTRRWMLLVHRFQDCYERISVNSLGFAGALLVCDHNQLKFLKTLTPIQLLAKVAHPRELT